MNYRLPEEVKNILDKFENAGYQIYIVGGAVRDLLMGREIRDWDFTTDAKPEEILKLFPEGFYDNKFWTVGIKAENLQSTVNRPKQKEAGHRLLTPNNILEITTMRKETDYKDFRHPGEMEWTDKIKEDLARRDFTINAMALEISKDQNTKKSDTSDIQALRSSVHQLANQSISESFQIIDPFGGQDDLNHRLIKAVGDPNKRFKEDALRLMRAIRIATELGFDIENNTFQAIKKSSSLIQNIAWERIRDELFKILGSMNPYIGIIKLREAGILPLILPEVEDTFGIVQEGPKHARIYDIGEHSLLTLKHTPSPDPLVRLAALLHDIGKPQTYKVEEDGNVTFFHHEIVGARMASKIAKRFNLSKKQSEKLYNLIRWHLFTVDENLTDAAIRRFIKNVGLENIEDMIALRIGDRLGGGTEKAVSWRMEKFKERIHDVLQKPFTVADLKVSGDDVMEALGIPPGPKVGEILNKLFEEVLEDASKNNREYLLEKIKSFKS